LSNVIVSKCVFQNPYTQPNVVDNVRWWMSFISCSSLQYSLSLCISMLNSYLFSERNC
jgi:hypothetical protein